MDNLQEFIGGNRVAFETEPLPEGHRERFGRKRAGLPSKEGVPAPLRRLLVACSAAAAVLGAVWLYYGRSVDPVGTEIVAYQRDLDCLSREITDLCRQNGADTAAVNEILRSIGHEAVPLYEQLPDEMSDAEKVRVLKRYFGFKLRAVKQLRAQLPDEQYEPYE